MSKIVLSTNESNFMHSYQQYVKLYNCNLGDCKIRHFSGDKSLFLGWHGSAAEQQIDNG